MTQAPDLQALYRQAISFHQNGQLAEAEQIYRQLMDALPLSAEPRQMLGMLRLLQGRNSEALELIDAALKIDPGNAQVLGNYGNALKGLGRREEALTAYDRALGISPDAHGLHYNRALLLQELNRPEDALAGYEKVLARQPDFVEALYNRGLLLMAMNRDQEALFSLDRALAHRPKFAEAWNNRGSALRRLGRPDEALSSFDKAVAIQPDYANAILNRGHLQHTILRRFDRALADYETALTLKPGLVEAWNNYGNALCELGRLDESLASFNRAREIDPSYAPTYYNCGIPLQKAGRFKEALASYDGALALKPDYIEALYNRGVLLLEMNRDAEALASVESILKLQPGSAENWNNQGTALQRLRRYDEAVASFDKALAIKPGFAEAHYNRGNALGEVNRFEGALASFDKALAIKPDFAQALNNRGAALEGLHRFEEALASYERARAIDPDHIYAFNGAANAALHLCDWPQTEIFGLQMGSQITASKSVIQPMTLLGYSADAALQFQCAKRCVQDKIGFVSPLAWGGTAYRHDKIRIAYLSADFGNHPVTHSVLELYERHDRSRFEVVGLSLGPNDGSEMRNRLTKAFDGFHDVHGKDSSAVAELMRNLEIDIAVDLNGHTQGARLDIFALRAAPVQVNYLGYPGTTGAEFIDYVIADKIILPFDRQPFFTEKIVHLPDSYFPGYSKPVVAEEIPSRQDAGLPERAFVFCCFNNSWKIAAAMFDIWMRLLHAVPGSVLWLSEGGNEIGARLRASAVERGIDPQRLIFAPRLERRADHLTRQRLADLFLDTLPYNAHATASDALRAGLPLITCQGPAFAGRVAASLLHAIGLPEMVTQNLEGYEALALGLARDTALLESFKLRLNQNQLTRPLFDTDRFRRNIETAYARMLDIAEQGGKPQNFSIEPQ